MSKKWCKECLGKLATEADGRCDVCRADRERMTVTVIGCFGIVFLFLLAVAIVVLRIYGKI